MRDVTELGIDKDKAMSFSANSEGVKAQMRCCSDVISKERKE